MTDSQYVSVLDMTPLVPKSTLSSLPPDFGPVPKTVLRADLLLFIPNMPLRFEMPMRVESEISVIDLDAVISPVGDRNRVSKNRAEWANVKEHLGTMTARA